MTPGNRNYSLRAYLAALALLLGLGLGYFLWDNHNKASHAAEVSVRNAVTTLEARIDSLLRHIESALDDIVYDLPLEKLSSQAASRHQGEINPMLALYAENFPEINSIRVIDAGGDELYRSRPPALPNVAGRQYLRDLAQNPRMKLHFSDVFTGAVAQQSLLTVSKPVADRNGRLRAVVNAAINLGQLEKHFSKIDLGKQGLVALRRSEDGRLIVRWPAVPAAVNQAQPSLFDDMARTGAREGVIRAVSPIDHIERLFAFRNVGSYPFRVIAAVSVKDYLAEWRRLAGISITVLVLVLAGMGYFHWRITERTAELETANKELEMFSYLVAHDLKAPLRGINGYSRVLLADHAARLDDEGRGFLQNIASAAQHMGQLIEDLLAYSQLGQNPMRMEQVGVKALIESLLADRAGEIKARGVAVSVAMPFSTVTANRDNLAMALRNLLDNALKFTRSAPQPMIEISGLDHGAMHALSVRDNGIGFEMKYRDKIFDIFQRLHRSEDYPGTGVGLAIARKAMQRMGGRVWAESEAGKGATFHLEIPK